MNYNLAASYYTDPAIFEREREQVFARSWQLLGPASLLDEAGRYVCTEIAGFSVFALRDDEDQLRAYHNICRHRGARLLADGNGQCANIRCPYHHWVYDYQGRLQNTPWAGLEAEDDWQREQWSLQALHIEQWRGLLFIAIEPAQTLAQQLGDTIDELADEPLEVYTAMHCERLEFAANWKIYIDNFVEGYHIPGIHPEFFTAVNFAEFETTAHDGLVRMSAPPQQEDLFYRGKWLWMWPNWTLSLFDGGINTSRINPLTPERTELIYYFYFADTSKAANARRHETIQRNLDIVREDFEICINTHKNYASGAYSPGPLSPRHEQGVNYFQQRLQQTLT